MLNIEGFWENALIGPETEIDFGFTCYGKKATDLNIIIDLTLGHI